MTSLPDRRRFLSVCTAVLMTGIGALIVAPVVAFVGSPLRRQRGKGAAGDDFFDAGAVSSIPVGMWTLLPIEIVRQDGWDKTKQSRSIWVLATGAPAGDIKVLSPICTHLGCPIGWSASASQFKCPCHGGAFSADGTLVSGPPPRGMDALEFQIRDEHLWVRWQDFRTGLSEKLAVEA